MSTVRVESEDKLFLFDADQGVALHHCSPQFDTEAEAALICALAQIRCEIRANRGTLAERVTNLEEHVGSMASLQTTLCEQTERLEILPLRIDEVNRAVGRSLGRVDTLIEDVIELQARNNALCQSYDTLANDLAQVDKVATGAAIVVDTLPTCYDKLLLRVQGLEKWYVPVADVKHIHCTQHDQEECLQSLNARVDMHTSRLDVRQEAHVEAVDRIKRIEIREGHVKLRLAHLEKKAFGKRQVTQPHKVRLQEILRQAPTRHVHYACNETRKQWMDAYEKWLADLTTVITSACMPTAPEMKLRKVFLRALDAPKGWVGDLIPVWVGGYNEWLIEMSAVIAECIG